jgi:uncharacterized protein (TIGR03437 family)
MVEEAGECANLGNPCALMQSMRPYYVHRFQKVLLILGASTCLSAQGLISTFAGLGIEDNIPATQARLTGPRGMVLDGQGNAYLAEPPFIRRVDHSTGIITTVAGNPNGQAKDGPALSVSAGATALAIDSSSRITLLSGFCLEQFDPAIGTVAVFAADCNISGVGGPLGYPSGLALDASGNAYVSDSYGARILKVDAVSHAITKIAGSGTITSTGTGDGGPALSATLRGPGSLAIDRAGNLLVIDGDVVRRIDLKTGIISAFAGNASANSGVPTSSGDGKLSTLASLNVPSALAVDLQNNVYIGEQGRVRKVLAATGIITTFAGTGQQTGDGIPALQANIGYFDALAVDAAGNLWIADTGNRKVRVVSDATGLISTVAGTSANGDGGPALGASFSGLADITANASGDLFLAEGNRIRRIDHATGIVSTVANGEPDTSGGAVSNPPTLSPRAITFDRDGNLLVAEENDVKKLVLATGTVTTVAGVVPFTPTCVNSFGGDGGPASKALFACIQDIAVDSSGNIFVADAGNFRVRRIDAVTGIVTTVAGNGGTSYSGDGNLAVNTSLGSMSSVAVGPSGDLYIAFYQRIVKVATTGIISTVAGTGSGTCYLGDGGPATVASVCPSHLRTNSAGDLLFAESASPVGVGGPGPSAVRMIAHDSGMIGTLAGGGDAAPSEMVAATSVQLIAQVFGLAGDSLYLTDVLPYPGQTTLIRRVTPAVLPLLPAVPGPFELVDGATFSQRPVSPGEIVSLLGNYLGPVQPESLTLDANGVVTKQLAGVQVFFNDIPSPLLYVSPGQINAIVPYHVLGFGSLTTRVSTPGGQRSISSSVSLTDRNPVIFRGAILNSDGSVNDANHPAPNHSTLVVFGTGLGRLVPQVPDGSVIQGPNLPKPSLSNAVAAYVSTGLGGLGSTTLPAQVAYLGAAPGLVAGVMQVNVILPAALPAGPATLSLIPVGLGGDGQPIFVQGP